MSGFLGLDRETFARMLAGFAQGAEQYGQMRRLDQMRDKQETAEIDRQMRDWDLAQRRRREEIAAEQAKQAAERDDKRYNRILDDSIARRKQAADLAKEKELIELRGQTEAKYRKPDKPDKPEEVKFDQKYAQWLAGQYKATPREEAVFEARYQKDTQPESGGKGGQPLSRPAAYLEWAKLKASADKNPLNEPFPDFRTWYNQYLAAVQGDGATGSPRGPQFTGDSSVAAIQGNLDRAGMGPQVTIPTTGHQGIDAYNQFGAGIPQQQLQEQTILRQARQMFSGFDAMTPAEQQELLNYLRQDLAGGQQ